MQEVAEAQKTSQETDRFLQVRSCHCDPDCGGRTGKGGLRHNVRDALERTAVAEGLCLSGRKVNGYSERQGSICGWGPESFWLEQHAGCGKVTGVPTCVLLRPAHVFSKMSIPLRPEPQRCRM